VILGATEEGDVSGLDRSQSLWRQPHEVQPYPIADAFPFTFDDTFHDRSCPALPKQGLEALLFRVEYCVARSVSSPTLSVKEAAAVYAKYYDEQSGYFYFVEKASGATDWCKPPQIPFNLPATIRKQQVLSSARGPLSLTSLLFDIGAVWGGGMCGTIVV
jgi:hypothetical protein